MQTNNTPTNQILIHSLIELFEIYLKWGGRVLPQYKDFCTSVPCGYKDCDLCPFGTPENFKATHKMLEGFLNES